jgi:hypothetical protein
MEVVQIARSAALAVLRAQKLRPLYDLKDAGGLGGFSKGAMKKQSLRISDHGRAKKQN